MSAYAVCSVHHTLEMMAYEKSHTCDFLLLKYFDAFNIARSIRAHRGCWPVSVLYLAEYNMVAYIYPFCYYHSSTPAFC